MSGPLKSFFKAFAERHGRALRLVPLVAVTVQDTLCGDFFLFQSGLVLGSSVQTATVLHTAVGGVIIGSGIIGVVQQDAAWRGILGGACVCLCLCVCV